MVERYFPQYALHDQAVLGLKESVDKVLALVPEDILYGGTDSREPLLYSVKPGVLSIVYFSIGFLLCFGW